MSYFCPKVGNGKKPRFLEPVKGTYCFQCGLVQTSQELPEDISLFVTTKRKIPAQPQQEGENQSPDSISVAFTGIASETEVLD